MVRRKKVEKVSPFGRKLRLKMERTLMMKRKEEEGRSLLKVEPPPWRLVVSAGEDI